MHTEIGVIATVVELREERDAAAAAGFDVVRPGKGDDVRTELVSAAGQVLKAPYSAGS